MASLLAARAEDAPSRLAFAFVGADGDVADQLSYAELDRTARRVGRALGDLADRGDRVLLLYPPGLEYVAAFLGCLSAGVIAVPAYPPMQRGHERLLGILSDARPRAVLTVAAAEVGLRALLAEIGHPELPVLGTGTDDGLEPLAPGRPSAPSDVAFLQYTSGSTATPRGVRVTHGNLMHNQRMIRAAFGSSADSVVVSWLPLYHDMGLIGGVLHPLFVGAPCYLLSPLDFLRDPALWLRTLSDLGGTISGGPNFAYDLCARKVTEEERANLDLRHWAVAFNGSEPVRAETLDRFTEAFSPAGFQRRSFHPCYGLAEATLLVTAPPHRCEPTVRPFDAEALETQHRAVPEASGRRLVSSGMPWLDQEVRIVETEGTRVVEDGQVGEICVRGESVASGYWGGEAGAFGARVADQGGFLRTGDLGFMVDGDLYVTGRLKDLIVIRGRNHYPQDLERTVEESHPAVRPGCVAAFSLDTGVEERLVVVAEVRSDSAEAAEVATAAQRAVLSRHQVHAHEVALVGRGQVPKTSSGKIRRRACRDGYLQGQLSLVHRQADAAGEGRGAQAVDAADRSPGATNAPVPPDALAIMRHMLAEVTGVPVDDVQPTSAPVTLGLDSLQAMEFAGALQQRHGIDIAVEALFSGASLADLAASATTSRRSAGETTTDPLPESPGGGIPLSSAQRRLWLAQQLTADPAAYNVAVAVRIRGAVDATALEAALQRLADRHDALRTRVVDNDGEPLQLVEDRVVVRLRRHDLSDAEGGPEAHRTRREEAARAPIEATSAPMWRAALVSVDPTDHELLLTFNHLVVDGWAVSRLVRELADGYAALAPGGRGDQLGGDLPTRPERQYRDFVAWERMARGSWQRGLDYWAAQLHGPLPLLRLPARHPSSAADAPSSAAGTLPAAVTERLSGVARQHGVTTSMLLLAVYGVLLQRICHQDHVIVGAPASTRPDDSFEKTAGCFLNTLPLRLDLSEQPSLSRLLGHVRDTVTRALDHRHVPFEEVLARTGHTRAPGRTPLFQAFFNSIAFGSMAIDAADGTTWEADPALDAGTKFELGLYCIEDGGRVRLQIVADPARLSGQEVDALLDAYVALLSSAVEDPERPVAAHSLMTPRAAAALPDLASPLPLAEWGESLVDALGRHGGDADAPAVAGPAEQWTYGELEATTNRLARHMRRRGIERGERVALVAERLPALAAAIAGALEAGTPFTVLDASHPGPAIAARLRTLRPRALLGITDEPLPGEVEDCARELGCLLLGTAGTREGWETILRDDPTAPLGERAAFDDPACVVFTSGSTGEPHGVVGRHGALTAFLPWQREQWALGPDDRFAMLSALEHDPLQRDVVTPLWLGASLRVPDDSRYFEPGYLAGWLRDERVTVVNLTPATGRLLSDGPERHTLPDLRLAFFVGETLTYGDVRSLREIAPNARIINLYGATETQRALSWHEPDPEASLPGHAAVPLGRGMPGMQLLVLAPHGGQAGIGEIGEIAVRSPAIALGYADPGSSEAVVDHPPTGGTPVLVTNPARTDPRDTIYRTGDLGRHDADGAVIFVGRDDRQIQVRGHRVEPAEVERVLLGLDGVREAAVVPVQGDSPTAVELAAFVGAPGQRPRAPELRAALRATLPSHLVPTRIEVFDGLPRLSNGKLDLTGMATTPPQADQTARLPSTPVEQRLAVLWSKLLDVPSPHVEDDFFEAGGHSLLATRLALEVRREFEIELSLHELASDPTLEGIARAIERGGANSGSQSTGLPEVVADSARRHEPFPLNDIQWAYWVGRSASLPIGNVASHVYWEFDAAALDVDRLERAWQRLVERHDMLRMVVRPDGTQEALASVPPYQIARHDLRGLPEDEVEVSLASVRERMSHLLRSGEEWPLFDIEVSRHDRGVRTHVSVDFLIGDASSWGVLAPELRRLYEDPDATLPPLELTFRDYVLAAKALEDDDRHARASEYWLQRLDTLPPAPKLPMRVDPSAIEQPRFVRHRSSLDASRWQAVQAHAARLGVTPSAALLAAFAEVLRAWSSSARFSLNVTLFNRLPLHPEVDEILGDFTSLTVLEVPDGGATLDQRAADLQRRLWRDLDHRWMSGVRVLRELAQRRGNPAAAALPVVFTSKLGLGDLVRHRDDLGFLGTPALGITQTPQVWLDHQVSEDPETGDLVFNWDVVEDLFPPGMVHDMFDAYGRLLDRLAGREAWEAEGHALVPRGQLEVRRSANATQRPLPQGLLHEPALAQAGFRPDSPAAITSDRVLSYRDLDGLSGRIATWLTDRGATANRLVGVVAHKGWEEIVGALGVLRAGAAYLPVPASLPDHRIRQLLALGEVELVLTQSAVDQRVDWPAGVETLQVDDLAAPDGTAAPQRSARPDDLAYVIFTSGSTGEPKGVMIEHRAARNTVEDISSRFGVGPHDRVLAISSLGFDLSVYDLFGLLGAGGAVVVPPEQALREPSAWLSSLREQRVTIWNSVPALVELLVRHCEAHGEPLPPSLRLVLMSGDWIPVDLPDRIRALKPDIEIVSLGGATEASIWSNLYPIGEVDPGWPSIPYGRPLSNQRFHVLDEAGRPRPEWVPGELAIAGHGLARGYWRQQGETRARFVELPGVEERAYLTGDLGRYLPSGDLEFLGRKDFQVKINGYRIELGEIEAVLGRHDAVGAAVVAAPGDRHARRLVAYIVTARDGQRPGDEALRQHLRSQLPEYMVPSQFVLLDRMPLTANGKVDRAALPEPAAQEAGPAAQPESAAERLVAKVFAELLGAAEIGRDQGFFEAGGSSVEIVEVQSRLKALTGVDIPMVTLFQRSTPKSLAAYLEQTSGGDVSQPEADPSRPQRDPSRATRRRAALQARRRVR